jgi:hypothetical protein
VLYDISPFHMTTPQQDSNLVSKKQIAQMLAGEGNPPLSVSTVEKLIAAARIEPAFVPERIGRGKVVLYRLEDAERLVRERNESKAGESQAVAVRPQQQGALVLGELLDNQRRGFESLRDVQDPWPPLMTREQVLQLSNLPPTWFDAGMRKGLIKHLGVGRARRYTRASVRSFCVMIEQASEAEQPDEALRMLLKPVEKA